MRKKKVEVVAEDKTAKKRKTTTQKAEDGKWHCVVRLPTTMADKLRLTAKRNGTSINQTIEVVIAQWLKAEKTARLAAKKNSSK